MLIFFGVRSPKIVTATIKKGTVCESCQQENTFKATVSGSYFHIFWIPIVTLGRSTQLKCSHCKKTYENDEIPLNIQSIVGEVLEAKKAKTPKWHSFGCFTIFFLIAFAFFSGCVTMIFNSFKTSPVSEEELVSPQIEKVEKIHSTIKEDQKETVKEIKSVKEEVPTRPQFYSKLNRVFYNGSYEPKRKSNPILFNLKACLEEDLDFMEPSSTLYASKKVKNKLLVLIDPLDYDTFSKQQIKVLNKQIVRCLNDIVDNKTQLYVGVFSEKDLCMQKSPRKMVTGEKAIEAELLSEFFE